MTINPERTVHCQDAISWLQSTPVLNGCSVVASPPDFSEFPGLSLGQWKEWLISTVSLILSKTPDDGVTILYQSDTKSEGTWISKAYLCLKAAEIAGHELLWHKVICRLPPGHTTFKRSSYTHILCFSKGLRLDAARSTPDVLPEMGDKTWERGMGFEACYMIAKFILQNTGSKTVVNPFCGHGSMLAMLNMLGLSAIGIERSKKCAEIARNLSVDLDTKKWLGAPNRLGPRETLGSTTTQDHQ